MIHRFELKGRWTGGRNSQGTIKMDALESDVSIPESMDGPGVGTNPDEMLLGAASTCYLITLAAILESSQVHFDSIELNSVAHVETDKEIPTFKEIIHDPTIIGLQSYEQTDAKIQRIFAKAESSCMISRAIDGNVKVTVK